MKRSIKHLSVKTSTDNLIAKLKESMVQHVPPIENLQTANMILAHKERDMHYALTCNTKHHYQDYGFF